MKSYKPPDLRCRIKITASSMITARSMMTTTAPTTTPAMSSMGAGGEVVGTVEEGDDGKKGMG